GDVSAVDAVGASDVAGDTTATNFPTHSPFQGSNAWAANGSDDAFVTKLGATGSALIYSTYLGGQNGSDIAYGIAVDSSGAAFVTGDTNSTNFPTQSPFQGSYAGSGDAFVININATGSTPTYSSYHSGTSNDVARESV